MSLTAARLLELYERCAAFVRPVSLSPRACNPTMLFEMVSQLRTIEEATARLRGFMPTLPSSSVASLASPPVGTLPSSSPQLSQGASRRSDTIFTHLMNWFMDEISFPGSPVRATLPKELILHRSAVVFEDKLSARVWRASYLGQPVIAKVCTIAR